MAQHWMREGLHQTPIEVGQLVRGFEGDRLGTVKAVGDAGFQLRRPGHDDVWVRNEAIYTSRPEGIKLICYKFGLDAWRLGGE
jgi:hypothetical protein